MLSLFQINFKIGMLLHPNVSPADGSVCEALMTAVFGPTKNISHLAQAIVGFLAAPNLGA
jgi:hypothetical protein